MEQIQQVAPYLSNKKNVKTVEIMEFKKIEELGEDHEEVIGFNEEWICPDFNSNDTRLCF